MMDKSQEAEKIIKKHVLYATAAGLVPVPLLDIAAVTGVLSMAEACWATGAE